MEKTKEREESCQMKNTKRVIGGVVLIAIMMIVTTYAVVTNVTLKIKGTGDAQASKDNFIVEFIGEPTTGGKGTISATINTSKRTEGTIDVTGLTSKGDTAIAIYTVKNSSRDLSADLTAKATSSNEDYFEVSCKIEDTTLKAGATTELTVTVELLKTPIDETKENLNADIGVSIIAEPKQPGEEANAGSATVTNTITPYLPTGFTQVTGNNLSTGLTIQDNTGNQYVWVEVPRTKTVYSTAGLEIVTFSDDEYTAIENDLHTYTNDYREDGYVDEYYSDATTGLTSDKYTELKKKMLKSIYQNGGFYVGKYEAGIEDAPKTSGSATEAPTETPVIKPNAYPYNYVTCSQAQLLAINMESGGYNTSLMFGVQWDLVLKYLETKGTKQEELKKDSTNWGNYSNNLWNITNIKSKYSTEYGLKWENGAYGEKNSDKGILLSTGASDTFSKQGIYDLAGNAFEWTIEKSSDSSLPCVSRGGACSNLGNSIRAASRGYSNATKYYNAVGFRISLF